MSKNGDIEIIFFNIKIKKNYRCHLKLSLENVKKPVSATLRVGTHGLRSLISFISVFITSSLKNDL
ncbi:hypothetical protein D3C80_1645150 [compost metagenome]